MSYQSCTAAYKSKYLFFFDHAYAQEQTNKYVLEWKRCFSFLDEVNQDNATTVCYATFQEDFKWENFHSSKFFPYVMFLDLSFITVSQNCRGWRRPLEIIHFNPSAKAGAL